MPRRKRSDRRPTATVLYSSTGHQLLTPQTAAHLRRPLIDRRRRYGVEHRADDRVAGDAFSLALEIADDAVTERRQGDRAHVIGGYVEAAAEQGVDLAGQDQRLGAAWRTAVANVLADQLRRAWSVRVSGRQQADGV